MSVAQQGLPLEMPRLSVSPASAQARNDSPEWIATIRVYGSIMYSTRKWGPEGAQAVPLTPEHIDAWMQDLSESGITTVLWRANCAGTLTYPSGYAPLAGESPIVEPLVRLGATMVKPGWPSEDWLWLGEQCRRFHTLDAAVRSAHRYHLKIILDFNAFDCPGVRCTRDEWPSGGQRCWSPDWWLWSKDQNERLVGIPFYGEPAVREHRVSEVAEALELGIDGVALGFFSHCDGLSGDRACWFGYNPPVVEEYSRRYGVDPLKEEVNAHSLYALHGEYFTQFVRDVSKAVRAKGKRLLVKTRTDGIHGWGGKEVGGLLNGGMGSSDLRNSNVPLPYAAGFYLEWEEWLQDDLADGIMVAAPAHGALDALARMKSQSEIPMYLWRKYTGFKGEVMPPLSLGDFRQEIESVRAGQIDGYCLMLMQITRHPFFVPDWRELLAGAS